MTAPTCPDCGTALPADSPQSLCPACLLRQALASRTVVNGDARSSAPPPTPEEIADKFPQFEILECLGRGGMGVVYKARQKSLKRLVAIKILAPDRDHEPRFAERFAREAELLARLNHPHIVTIHDFGETGGLFFLVMEFVDGVNLRDLLRDGKLEPKQALAVVPPICEALQYAHDKGIVHRDIKPENLLLDREGRIKIADFGIAALMGAEGENAGTPPYMAPEQGGDRGGIDHRADLYALGVVLYEMLTGERPGKDLVAPSRKVQIDVRLDEMVLRALEKEPERRYQTAGEFRTVVETLQTPDEPAPAIVPPLPAVATEAPGPFRRFWWLLLVMPPVCMLLGLGLGFLWATFAPKVYEARTLVQYARSGEFSQPEEWMNWADSMRSNESLQQVSERLDLDRSWMVPHGQAAQKLRKLFDVRQIRGTDLLELSVRHTDPTEAAAIANELILVDQARATARKVSRKGFIVHEEATVPTSPVSPNAPLVLAISAAAGFLLSPLLALLLIFKLGRSKGGAGPAAASKPGPVARFLLLFSTIAFPVGLLGAGVGWLLSHFLPNIDGSQNLARNLALIGMMLSPLAALGVMFFQSRRPGGAYDPASKSSKRWILVSQLAMVILVVLGKSWLVPVTPSSDSGKTLIGRAKFDFEIPRTLSGGWGAELPVFKGRTSRWFPPNGQQVQMKDGRTLYFRVLTMAPANGRPKLFVGISENGSDWTSESAEMGPSRRSATLDLEHGVKATLHWNPSTGSVPGAGGHPLAEPRSNPVFLIVAGIVVLLLLIGGIGVIVRLARSSQSRGSKAAGIGCTVLLLGGLLLGLVPATVYLSFRAKAVESARDWRQAQKEEMAKIEAEVEGRSEGRPVERPQFVPAAEGPTIQIGVHGSVARPGTYTLRADATLLDALAAAGGWTDKAKLDEVFINFGGKGSAYDLRKILDGRDPNPALATGHNVFVARRKP
jgi:tRNA A-37 threonylcarbamoyl transferase component Bud32/capsular polysaccharide biosynthesis protein